ncbi:MAG: SGNH/GDSL hydrolase family protein [Thermoanaerobaculia bacterium]
MSEGVASPRPFSLARVVAVILAVDVVLLLLLEGAARLFLPATEASRLGELSRLTVELGLPALQKVVLPDPLLFWKLRPGLPVTLIEGRIGPSDPIRFRLSTTAAGFRVPEPEGSPAVVCLGDSCTFGLGVEDGETFPARLQALTALSVLNAGVPGYSSFQGRRLLEERIRTWRPQVVVIQFGWNDAAVWDGRSDAEHAALLARGPGLLLRSRLLQLLARLLPRQRSRSGEEASLPARPRLTPVEFGEELRAMIRLSRSESAAPLLVLWPARHHLQGSRMAAHLDVLREVAASDGVPLVDLVEVFSREGGSSLYADAVHANPAGHRAVAEAIARTQRGSSHPPTRESNPVSSSAGASDRPASPRPSETRSPPSSSSSDR